MEAIDITVEGTDYIANYQEDGSFEIREADQVIGRIYPEDNVNMRVYWKSDDLSDPELAQKIGEAIERAEL
jgi:hypothetical protein